MRLLLLTLLLLIASASLGQISRYNQRKIDRILGESLVSMPTEASYRPYFECDSCEKDSSDVFVGLVDGAERNNELILHHSLISFRNETEAGKYVSKEALTLREYEVFENWVRDSNALDRIYYGIDAPYYTFKGFIFKKTGKPIGLRHFNIYDEGRETNRELFRFDRDYDLTKEYQWHPKTSRVTLAIADLFIPAPERFCGMREIDKRKLVYHYGAFEILNDITFDTLQHYFPRIDPRPNYNDLKHFVLVQRNESDFARKSIHHKDMHSVLGELATKTLKSIPVYGANGIQAKAFCHWKTEVLQKEFNKHAIPYHVVVTLPTSDDSDAIPLPKPEIMVPEKTLSDQWKITNHDYLQFIHYVKDSIQREHIFLTVKSKETANDLILYQETYFSENDLEFIQFEPYERAINLEIFPLNFHTSIDYENPEIDSLIQLLPTDELLFRYTERDVLGSALPGIYVINPELSPNPRYPRSYMLDDKLMGTGIGKIMVRPRINCLGENISIRFHPNLQTHLCRDYIDVLPENGNQIPDNEILIQSITYEQALAYYNWKRPIHKAHENDDWQDYLYPSREEYAAVQQGETIVQESTTIPYVSPTFRYVVHLYPK